MTRSEGTDAFTYARAKQTFAEAWADPRHTRFELPPVDVNAVLESRYVLDSPARMDFDALWDMEVKKAWDPQTYIPYVVSAARSWGRHPLEEGCERFFRASDQLGWISGARGQVLEDVSISWPEHKIFFLGRRRFADADGRMLEASDFQPLFHVEHAATGAPDRPVNMWRIVILTEAEDVRYKQPFEKMVVAGLLPGFIEEYIKRDMGVQVQRR